MAFKGKGKGNGRRGGNFSRSNKKGKKPYVKEDKEMEITDKEGRSNDPIWYMYNGTVVTDAASLSYSNPLGIPFDYVKFNQWGNNVAAIIPTLMNIKFTPTPGNLKNGTTSPVNIQARAIYTKLQKSVSMKLPFSAADVAIHICAVDSLYIMYEYCQRIYGIYRTFNAMDRTVPEVYYRALGLNPDTMESQMSIISFKHRLNKIGTDLSRLFIPNKLAILERHKWMCRNIFLDSPSVKAQQYMFTPTGLWQFNPNPEAQYGGILEFTYMPDFSASGLYGVIHFFEELLHAITNDVDMWTMNGYLLRAYEPSECVSIQIIDDNYQVFPIYSLEVLTQIHNMDVVGPWYTSGTKVPVIRQDEYDNIVWTPELKRATIGDINMNGKKLIDMPFNAPTPADNLVATRLCVYGYGSGVAPVTLTAYGTEIVNQIEIHRGTPETNLAPITYNNLTIACSVASGGQISGDQYAGVLINIAPVLHFAFCPMLRITNDAAMQIPDYDGSQAKIYDVLSDLTNYTYISFDDLDKLHDAATMGEWFIPTDVSMNIK